MSKAFTKEDADSPERSGRKRSSSGLPPGALNYMTADGARRLRTESGAIKNFDRDRAREIEQILASVTIVEPPAVPPAGAVFGAKVTVRDGEGRLDCYRIVGLDEVGFQPGSVSWTSLNGRALLGAEPGQRVILEVEDRSRKFTVVRIDY